MAQPTTESASVWYKSFLLETGGSSQNGVYSKVPKRKQRLQEPGVIPRHFLSIGRGLARCLLCSSARRVSKSGTRGDFKRNYLKQVRRKLP